MSSKEVLQEHSEEISSPHSEESEMDAIFRSIDSFGIASVRYMISELESISSSKIRYVWRISENLEDAIHALHNQVKFLVVTKLSPDEFQHFLEELVQNDSVSHLDIRSIRITQKCAQDLSRVLQLKSNISQIDLNGIAKPWEFFQECSKLLQNDFER